MNNKKKIVSAALMATGVAMAVVASLARMEAQQKPWTPHRTAWGDPDLQGIWTDDAENLTPVQRPTCEKPDGYTNSKPLDCSRPATQEFLTDAEYAQRLKMYENRIAAQESGAPEAAKDLLNPGLAPSAAGHIWNEYTPSRPSRRTSMIVSPSDGRVPPLTPEGQKRLDAIRANRLEERRKRGGAAPSATFWAQNASSWFPDVGIEYWSRCITRSLPGGWIAKQYNNNRQILQTPGYVVIVYEGIHDVRIIPLDGRPHASQAVREYMGDSRGHWEGNTLVVEVTNLPPQINPTGDNTSSVVDYAWTPITDKAKLIERYIPVDDHHFTYEVTISDPGTWTKPITLRLDQTKDDRQTQIMEYACHEGNYNFMELSVGGVRVLDAEANAKLGKAQ